MIIIFYRDEKTNNITRVHESRPGQTMADIKPLVDKYNSENQFHEIAEVVEVADDSLEAYLYRRKDERKKWDKEKVEDAIESIRHALYCVQDLED